MSRQLARPAHAWSCSVNGRRYFAEWARRLNLDSLDPDAVQNLPSADLKTGPTASRRGGKVMIDLIRLSPEEIAERRRLSEEFLKQPVEHVPAEDESGAAQGEGTDDDD